MRTTTIEQLMSVRDRPAVSVICPTHRTAPENRQDPIRLRGLIAQAGDRLSAALPEEESAALMDRLAELERRIDYQHTREGVGLFVAGGTAELVQFPVEVQPRVSVRDGFPPLPLVAALNRSTRYRVLVLSEKPTRLYESGTSWRRSRTTGSRWPTRGRGAPSRCRVGTASTPPPTGTRSTASSSGRWTRVWPSSTGASPYRS